MTVSPQLPPPPRNEINRLNTNAQLPQLTCIHMTIHGPQRTVRPRLAAILDSHDAIKRQVQDAREDLAHLVLGHAVVAGELQDPGDRAGVGGDVDAHARHVGRVRRRADRPVIHLDCGGGISARLVPLPLRLPQRVDQGVHRGLGVVVLRHRVAIQHRHAQGRGLGVFLHDALAVEFGLAVDVGRSGRRGDRVRCFAWHAWEHVVGRDVDEEGPVGGARLRQVFCRRYVQQPCGVWVLCTGVWLAVGRAWIGGGGGCVSLSLSQSLPCR